MKIQDSQTKLDIELAIVGRGGRFMIAVKERAGRRNEEWQSYVACTTHVAARLVCSDASPSSKWSL